MKLENLTNDLAERIVRTAPFDSSNPYHGASIRFTAHGIGDVRDYDRDESKVVDVRYMPEERYLDECQRVAVIPKSSVSLIPTNLIYESGKDAIFFDPFSRIIKEPHHSATYGSLQFGREEEITTNLLLNGGKVHSVWVHISGGKDFERARERAMSELSARDYRIYSAEIMYSMKPDQRLVNDLPTGRLLPDSYVRLNDYCIRNGAELHLGDNLDAKTRNTLTDWFSNLKK